MYQGHDTTPRHAMMDLLTSSWSLNHPSLATPPEQCAMSWRKWILTPANSTIIKKNLPLIIFACFDDPTVPCGCHRRSFPSHASVDDLHVCQKHMYPSDSSKSHWLHKLYTFRPESEAFESQHTQSSLQPPLSCSPQMSRSDRRGCTSRGVYPVPHGSDFVNVGAPGPGKPACKQCPGSGRRLRAPIHGRGQHADAVPADAVLVQEYGVGGASQLFSPPLLLSRRL